MLICTGFFSDIIVVLISSIFKDIIEAFNKGDKFIKVTPIHNA